MPTLTALLMSCIALMVWHMPASAQEAPKGLHCDLTQPPEVAGELPISLQDFGVFARVYPRVTEVLDGYSGCQAIWSEASGLGGKPYFVIIERGEVVGIWPRSPERLCRKGEDPRTGCRDPLLVMAPSYPAGCLRQAKASGQLSPACVAAFMSESQELDARRLAPLLKSLL